MIMSICNAQTSWKGTVSADWNTATNWTAGVPTASVDVIIGDDNFTGSFQPKLTVTAFCKSLIIGNGSKVSKLTVATNLAVFGNIIIGKKGKVFHVAEETSISIMGDWINHGKYAASYPSSVLTFTGTNQSQLVYEKKSSSTIVIIHEKEAEEVSLNTR